MRKGFEDLQFVQSKGLGIDGFGIIAEVDLSENKAYVMSANMEENFGTDEISLNNLIMLDENDIISCIEEINNDKERFVYFIIQLNDISELSKYHIEEDNFVMGVRKNNEICIHLAEQ